MKKKFCINAWLLFFVFISADSFAQSWNTNGNTGTNPATDYIGTTDVKDFVFKTNAVEKGRLKANGVWQFGTSVNQAKIDTAGNLTFSGTGAYKVAGNKYAFQYLGNPNYGLFFNSTFAQYEFRNNLAAPVFQVNANNGNSVFNGTVKIGAYTLPATDGANGQVLKTNGAGVLTWNSDNETIYSAGTGIGIGSGIITNTSPDQVVTFTGTGAATITGSYPNFTVNSTDLDAQTLTLNGSNLSISNGNSVALPTYTTYSAGTGIGIAAGVISNTGDTNAGDDITTASTAGGDASGTFSALSVIKIRGVNVSTSAPLNGQVLKYNSGTLKWEPATDANTTYTAGTGISIVGTTVSNTGDTNASDDLTTASTSGGDISGIFSAMTVNKIKGINVSATVPTNTQVLKYNSGTLTWEPATDANTTYTAGTGITLTGTVFSNKLSTGVAGGQSVNGGTAAGNNLTLNSTTNATKGKILMGASSAYDEVNSRLGIGTTTPSAPVQVFTGGTASLAGTGYLVLGSTNNSNLAFDNGVIQSRFNGAAGQLYLNVYGGGTRIGGAAATSVDINENGNIGIGGFSSTQKMNIQGLTTSTANVVYVQSNYNGGNTNVVGINSVSEIADGYGTGLTASGGLKGVQGTANAGAFAGSAYGVLGYSYGTAGTRIGIYGNASGGTTNWAGYFVGDTYMSGNLKMGTTSGATGYRLAVNGKIICTELRIATYASWPDFVFNEDYKLMPLSELEKSIQAENHLPGIPSAYEVECEGFDIGTMQANLLQKIEELSLYVIELNKQNEELRYRITNLENK